jgi:hypothetical protein
MDAGARYAQRSPIRATQENVMPRFVEVEHRVGIAAPTQVVRAQFGDLDHHIEAAVHPKLSYRPLAPVAGRQRFEQKVRLLGFTQRDVFEREWLADGSLRDTSIEGFNRGGSVHFTFTPAEVDGRSGTDVVIRVCLPLPAALAWLAPLLRAQVLREVTAAAREDKHDIEQRRYVPASALGARSVEAATA